MTAHLPGPLLAMFKPGQPLKYVEPCAEEPHAVTYVSKMGGVAQYVSLFEDPKDTPAPTFPENKKQRHARKAVEKSERVKNELDAKKAAWDPNTDPNIPEGANAFKTLFVGRLHYSVDEEQLRKEFDVYGKITHVTVIANRKTGKPRGMAFIEFENERDMHAAFKHADGKKVEGKRIVVDVERGRTVKDWLPRRLGGGLGATRRGPPDVCIKTSGRVQPDRDSRDADRDRGRSRGDSRDRERRDRSRDRERRDRSRDRDRRGGDRDRRDGDRDRRDRDRERDRRDSERGRDRERGRGDRHR
eukprot:m.58500 g.58500  ORF g.58500 m.58500 type:complete len:301 (+) comp15657_c0_seq1:162-1064(+)